MSLSHRINAFVQMGAFLRKITNKQTEIEHTYQSLFESFEGQFQKNIHQASLQNAWFTKENILTTFEFWGDLLQLENLQKWISPYDISKTNPKKIALILAGNIPMVGFHDFLCVIISGHTALVKLSSQDRVLLPFIADFLRKIEPSLEDKIIFSEEKITDFDAVIATGSNNTSRYFEYYFGKKPNIIRKNRNSVAVLTGEETSQDLFELGKDIFTYFGLGCRNVSKIYVPEKYDFEAFFQAIYPYHPIINHVKYANNYDYNKAVYLMSLFQLKENGFLILKEDSSYSSPIATLFFEFYTDTTTLRNKLEQDKDQIQCVVAKDCIPNSVPFGRTQLPELWQYADQIDTMDFLTKLP